MSKKYFLTLSDGLAEYVDEQGTKLGIPPQDYIQHLIIKDMEEKLKQEKK